MLVDVSENLQFFILDCLCFDGSLCIFLALWMLSLIFQTVNMIHFNVIVKRATTRNPLLQRVPLQNTAIRLNVWDKKSCFDDEQSPIHLGDAENMLLAILMIYVTFCCDIMTLCREFVQFRTCNE